MRGRLCTPFDKGDPLVRFVFEECRRQGRFTTSVEKEAGVGRGTMRFWRRCTAGPCITNLRAIVNALGYEIAVVPMGSSRASGEPNKPETYKVGWLELDERRRTVVGGPQRRTINLTDAQFLFLACLMRRPGMIRTHGELLDAMSSKGGPNVCSVVAHEVRDKVKRYASIEPEHGVGYWIEPVYYSSAQQALYEAAPCS